MKKLNIFLERLTKYASSFGFVIIFILTLIQIIYRNLFGGGFSWIEEVSTLLLSVFAFFAISYSIRKYNYTFLDYFYNKLSGRIQFYLSTLTYLAMTSFLLYVFYTSVGFAQRQWHTVSSILSWPRSFWYVSFPLNCIIMASFFTEDLMKLMRKRTGVKKGD